MKTYVLTVEIPEGCDEFWEAVDLMQHARERRKMVRDEIKEVLDHAGWNAKVSVALVRKTKP